MKFSWFEWNNKIFLIRSEAGEMNKREEEKLRGDNEKRFSPLGG